MTEQVIIELTKWTLPAIMLVLLIAIACAPMLKRHESCSPEEPEQPLGNRKTLKISGHSDLVQDYALRVYCDGNTFMTSTVLKGERRVTTMSVPEDYQLPRPVAGLMIETA